jgi:YVTN family beta-propeller protein
MKKMMLLFLFFILIITGCSSDDPITPPVVETSKGVYIINEGLFGQNNSSLTFYNLETKELVHNAYAAANNSQPLGDNANSIVLFGNMGYIAVDNSNKIEVINLNDFKSSGFIDLGQNGSPREMVILNETAGYVTSLYLDQVIKFNPATKEVIKRISVGSKPEGIVEAGGKLFVANSGFGTENSVSVIDLGSDLVTGTIRVGYNPRTVLKEEDGTVVVVCTGSYTDTSLFSGIYKINSATNSVTDSIRLGGSPGDAVLMGGNRILVTNNSGVNLINHVTKQVPSTPLIGGMAVNSIYGMINSIAYDANRKIIFCGNPKDYQQAGEVVLFSETGGEISRFTTGINPGGIVIR